MTTEANTDLAAHGAGQRLASRVSRRQGTLASRRSLATAVILVLFGLLSPSAGACWGGCEPEPAESSKLDTATATRSASTRSVRMRGVSQLRAIQQKRDDVSGAGALPLDVQPHGHRGRLDGISTPLLF